MRPWLLQIGPFLMPTEAREELNAISTGLTREEFAEKLWRLRIDAAPAVRKSHRRNWPMRKAVPAKDNVTRLPVKKRRGA